MSKVTRSLRKSSRLLLSAGIVSCVLCLVTSIFAKEINFEATLDRTKVPLGESVQLNLIFNGTHNMPGLELPEIEGFQSRYIGPSSSMSIINGQVSSSITHLYKLLPIKVGAFKIGPLKFDYNNDTYVSNSITIEVVEPGASPGPSSEEKEGPQAKDLSDRVFVMLETKKNKLYLNEEVPLTIKLYVLRLAIRDIQPPEIAHEGFSLGQLEQPKQYQENVFGALYDVIELNTTFFGIRPGEFRLGPASLKCNLVVKKETKRNAPSGFEDFFGSNMFDDFFGRFETYPLVLKSADIPVTVTALPQIGKPQDFSGALGDFDLEAVANPAEVKAGDPVTLKMTVRGKGNFSTVAAPSLLSTEGFKVYEPQVKLEPDQKIFEQVIIPLNADISRIPEVRFSFFNTDIQEYRTLTKGPFPVKVIKPENDQQPRIVDASQQRAPLLKEEAIGRDIIYIKDTIGILHRKQDYLYQNKVFLFTHLILTLGFFLLWIIHLRAKKLSSDVRYARKLLAPKKAKAGILRAHSAKDKGAPKEFYDQIFLILQEYLGDRFHLPSKGITKSIVEDTLKQKSISQEILQKVRFIFEECDMARYADKQLNQLDMQKTVLALEEVIDYLQRTKV